VENTLLEHRPRCRVLLALAALLGWHASTLAAETASTYPHFKVDPAWPKQLPNNYLFGNIGGITVDAQDHIWVLSRPRTLAKTDDLGQPPTNSCCVAAPAVTELDAAGNYLQGWGGPDPTGRYQWPDSEHGITVDYKGNVWICGNARNDNQCLKFTHDGRFLLQIGHAGQSKGSLDTGNLRQAAQVAVWPASNEVFIADGYGNRRVIVFDADSGKFKRLWGAYGQRPDDSAPRGLPSYDPASRQFNLVHGIAISKDGLVYVSDRQNNRIQVFTLAGKFVKEGFVGRATVNREYGTTFSSAFSGDKEQRFLYDADDPNEVIHVLDRQSMQEIAAASFGHEGPYAGQFIGLHIIAADSAGNIYSAESDVIGRVQKFVYQGLSQ
jgi:DNA-binding beta-propeller fold protein YncE